MGKPQGWGNPKDGGTPRMGEPHPYWVLEKFEILARKFVIPRFYLGIIIFSTYATFIFFWVARSPTSTLREATLRVSTRSRGLTPS
jgi:hypothetical protein